MRVWVLFGISKNPIKRFLGRVIESVDEVPFQHTALAVQFSHETQPSLKYIDVFEAHYPESGRTGLADWGEKYTLVEAYEMHSCESTDIVNFLYPQLCKKYAFIQLAMIMISKHWSRIKSIIVEENGTRSLICSELVANFLTPVYKVDFNEDEDYISLKDVQRVCKLIGNPVKALE